MGHPRWPDTAAALNRESDSINELIEQFEGRLRDLMPGMDGFTFINRLRDDCALRAVRIVAVSVLATDADLKRTWLAGFDGHLVKPIDYEIIAALLERLFWAPRRV